MIVVDPRFTRTAAKADQYIRIRSGTDIPFLFGMLHHIFKNGWEDKKYIADRVYGMDKVREDVLAKWTPDKVFEACGVDEATCYLAAKTMAENRPSTLVWCMGQTQHTIGNAMVRASCIVQLALGNVGVSGGGANIFRGHDNVQGATDVGPNPDSLPGYYGLAEGAWKHFAKVWGVDFEWIKKQYAPGMMGKPGMTVSRWIDGVLEKNELIDQDSNLRGLFFWGHAPNSQRRGAEMKKAMDKLDLLVVIDPYPSASAAMAAMPGKPEGRDSRPIGTIATGRSLVERGGHGQPVALSTRRCGRPRECRSHARCGREPGRRLGCAPQHRPCTTGRGPSGSCASQARQARTSASEASSAGLAFSGAADAMRVVRRFKRAPKLVPHKSRRYQLATYRPFPPPPSQPVIDANTSSMKLSSLCDLPLGFGAFDRSLLPGDITRVRAKPRPGSCASTSRFYVLCR